MRGRRLRPHAAPFNQEGRLRSDCKGGQDAGRGPGMFRGDTPFELMECVVGSFYLNRLRFKAVRPMAALFFVCCLEYKLLTDKPERYGAGP
ncbi:hypothetical protein [Paenibacillus piri]|uniref:Uncharacterized protein n=1 Tax=Paenibacillus piri TaxID=2547395 RepID=A0A4R5KW18_9BACL|nr:hypothetical protein [Paenibacillus piri]TDG00184.1 hypothetical protein E1757_00620 [Paenibacillus piri]